MVYVNLVKSGEFYLVILHQVTSYSDFHLRLASLFKVLFQMVRI